MADPGGQASFNVGSANSNTTSQQTQESQTNQPNQPNTGGNAMTQQNQQNQQQQQQNQQNQQQQQQQQQQANQHGNQQNQPNTDGYAPGRWTEERGGPPKPFESGGGSEFMPDPDADADVTDAADEQEQQNKEHFKGQEEALRRVVERFSKEIPEPVRALINQAAQTLGAVFDDRFNDNVETRINHNLFTIDQQLGQTWNSILPDPLEANECYTNFRLNHKVLMAAATELRRSLIAYRDQPDESIKKRMLTLLEGATIELGRLRLRAEDVVPPQIFEEVKKIISSPAVAEAQTNTYQWAQPRSTVQETGIIPQYPQVIASQDFTQGTQAGTKGSFASYIPPPSNVFIPGFRMPRQPVAKLEVDGKTDYGWLVGIIVTRRLRVDDQTRRDDPSALGEPSGWRVILNCGSSLDDFCCISRPASHFVRGTLPTESILPVRRDAVAGRGPGDIGDIVDIVLVDKTAKPQPGKRSNRQITYVLVEIRDGFAKGTLEWYTSSALCKLLNKIPTLDMLAKEEQGKAEKLRQNELAREARKHPMTGEVLDPFDKRDTPWLFPDNDFTVPAAPGLIRPPRQASMQSPQSGFVNSKQQPAYQNVPAQNSQGSSQAFVPANSSQNPLNTYHAQVNPQQQQQQQQQSSNPGTQQQNHSQTRYPDPSRYPHQQNTAPFNTSGNQQQSSVPSNHQPGGAPGIQQQGTLQLYNHNTQWPQQQGTVPMASIPAAQNQGLVPIFGGPAAQQQGTVPVFSTPAAQNQGLVPMFGGPTAQQQSHMQGLPPNVPTNQQQNQALVPFLTPQGIMQA